MSDDYQRLFKEKFIRLQQELDIAEYHLKRTKKQLEAANVALASAHANEIFSWRWILVAFIFLTICILSAKGDERAQVDAMLDRVVAMSQAFEQIKSVCDARPVSKMAVQTILSIVAATNTTGAC